MKINPMSTCPHQKNVALFCNIDWSKQPAPHTAASWQAAIAVLTGYYSPISEAFHGIDGNFLDQSIVNAFVGWLPFDTFQPADEPNPVFWGDRVMTNRENGGPALVVNIYDSNCADIVDMDGKLQTINLYEDTLMYNNRPVTEFCMERER